MTDSQKLDLLIHKVSNLGENMSEMKGEIRVLKEDMSEVKGEILVLKKDMSEVKEEIRVLKEDMSKVKGEISVLKEDIAKMYIKFDGLRRYDFLILDEVERVHAILNRHMNNKSAHLA